MIVLPGGHLPYRLAPEIPRTAGLQHVLAHAHIARLRTGQCAGAVDAIAEGMRESEIDPVLPVQIAGGAERGMLLHGGRRHAGNRRRRQVVVGPVLAIRTKQFQLDVIAPGNTARILTP